MPDPFHQLARLCRLLPGDGAIRTRLLWLALFPLAVVLPLLLAVLAGWGNEFAERLLVTKVRSDLTVAHGYFERVTEGVGSAVESLAGSQRLALALARPPAARAAALADLLDAARQRGTLDFLRFVPADGPTEWRLQREARAGRPAAGLDVFSPQQLAAIAPALAERASIPLIATRNAAPDARAVEARGLVLHAAAPVLDAAGRLVGVLEGGLLLNKNLAFIDRLNDIVYPEGALPFGSQGTATLFLGDVRVATNVRLFEGERAIGTRVSAAVRERVLGGGETWLDRAFVVSDWYVSGYRPLVDGQGERVGMLYVGVLEAPFLTVQRQGMFAIIGLFGLAMLAAGAFAAWRARQISRPVERLHATMTAIEGGDRTARVGPLDSGDELDELAAHFDRLLEQLAAQAQALQRWGEALDAEVNARTADLQQALADLKAAQSHLLTQEKLAAIGQLTAGLAHEVNNPVAVIQGNVEVMREVLGHQAEPVTEEIRLILEQVQRVRLIVAKLLQFARPHDDVGDLEPVDGRQLIQDCLPLVAHLLKKSAIAVDVQVHTARQVHCQRSELQQVMINLMVNAIEAMPSGGSLRLTAEDWDESEMPLGLCLSVIDTGPGLSAAAQLRLFTPFHTVGKAGGNGLGLWVSQSLVERYGGRITVESAPGAGCRFSVWLRAEPLSL